jgi:hypothetical protein
MSNPDRDFFGYSTRPDISERETKLSDLAAQWRGTKGNLPDGDKSIVEEYHQVLHELETLGWTDWLDADAELPKRLMPESYLKRANQ